ncbi:MAG: T9SS type A sorting domain-containing protein [Bacteroidetes bacterium]|nr:T9SS type A sorting domain-containing protein [Bacteroidota bacterium]
MVFGLKAIDIILITILFFLSGVAEYGADNICIITIANRLESYSNILYNNASLDSITSSGSLFNQVLSIANGIYEGDNNITYYSDPNSQLSYYWFGSVSYNKTLADHKIGVSADAASSFADPKFIKPVADLYTSDLHITKTSPANAMSTSKYSLVYDIDSNQRSEYTPHDAGCYTTSFCPKLVHKIGALDSILCGGQSINIFTSQQYEARYQWLRNDTVMIGDTLSSINATSSGVYRLIRISSCKKDTSNPVTLTSKKHNTSNLNLTNSSYSNCAPSFINFLVGGTSGLGNLRKLIYVNGQLKDSTEIDSFALLNPKSGDSIHIEIYSVECGREKLWTSGNIGIHFLNRLSPRISINSQDTNVCEGSPTLVKTSLLYPGTAPVVVWYKDNLPWDSLNNDSIVFSKEKTSYKIKAKLVSNESCVTSNQAISNELTIIVKPKVAPTILISGNDTNICEGSNSKFKTVLTSSGLNPKVFWYKDNQPWDSLNIDSIVFIKEKATYKVKAKLISSDNCVTTNQAMSNELTVIVKPKYIYSLITNFIDSLVDSGATCAISVLRNLNNNIKSEYQWYNNNSKVGLNDSILVLTNIKDSGVYYCKSWTECSDTFISGNVKIRLKYKTNNNGFNILNSGTHIYPNPFTDELYISSQVNFSKIELLDASGHIIWSSNIINLTSESIVPTNTLSSGVYILKLVSPEGWIKDFKVVKIIK